MAYGGQIMSAKLPHFFDLFFEFFFNSDLGWVGVIFFIWTLLFFIVIFHRIATFFYELIIPKILQKWLRRIFTNLLTSLVYIFHLATRQRYTKQNRAKKWYDEAQIREKDIPDVALNYYNRSITLHEHPDTLNRRGLVLFNMKKYSLAILDFAKASDLDPQNGEYLYNIGKTQWKLGKEELALKKFEEGAALHNHHSKQELEKEKNIIRCYVVECFTDAAGNSEAIVKNNDNLYTRVKRVGRNFTLNELLKLQRDQFPLKKWFHDSDYALNTLFYKKNKIAAEKVLQENLKISNILSKYGIRHLYHMTHIDNLPSILQNGLLSHNAVRQHYNMFNDISNNDVNVRRRRQEPLYNRSIHNYVPLYFNPKNPMLYVKKDIQADIVILAIDRALIAEKESLFTDGNAASMVTKFFNNLHDLPKLNWKCIKDNYWADYEDGKRVKCAEVLVNSRISPSAIQMIYVKSNETFEKTKKILNRNSKVEISRSGQFYFPDHTTHHNVDY